MTERSRYRLLIAAQLVAAISVLAACSGSGVLENRDLKAVHSGAGVSTHVAALSDAFADMTPSSSMVELQHFDAYEYYRDVFDLHAGAETHADTQTVSEPLNGNDADRSFFSCFRSRDFR